MAEEDGDLRAEVVTFRCKEAYVYSVPPASTIGHRAETWNVDKWLQEVSVRVITQQDDCWVRLLDFKTGETFADCPIPNNKPLQTAVEPVVDSSRYFVLRLVDSVSGRHAFMGLGFRERGQASDFNTALFEHGQYLRRKREAAEMRQAYEDASSREAEDAGPATPQQDLSLKPGQTLKLKLSNSALASNTATPAQRKQGLMFRSGMPSPFTPGGALQIPSSKSASRLEAGPGSSMPSLPPPPAPNETVSSDAEPASSTLLVEKMRVSMEDISLQDSQHEQNAAAAAAAATDTSKTEVEDDKKAQPSSRQPSSKGGSSIQQQEEKVPADDWGDFMGDEQAG